MESYNLLCAVLTAGVIVNMFGWWMVFVQHENSNRRCDEQYQDNKRTVERQMALTAQMTAESRKEIYSQGVAEGRRLEKISCETATAMRKKLKAKKHGKAKV